MKREILFRGKRIDNGEWSEGDLIKTGVVSLISMHIYDRPNKNLIIISETVGQFTGLTDKNGINIFEGDIVKMNGFSMVNRIEPIVGKLDYFAPDFSSQPISTLIGCGVSFEVIGNIHDNPDLIL